MLLRTLRPSVRLLTRWSPSVGSTDAVRRASAQAYAEQGTEAPISELEQVEYDPSRSNFTVITGKVIAAPFYNQIPKRGDVTNLMLAIKSGREKNLILYVEVWGAQALPAYNQLGKGAQVEVEGQLVPAQRKDKGTNQMVDSIKLRASAIRTVVYGEAPAEYGAEQPPQGQQYAAYAPPQADSYQDPYQQPQPQQQQQQYVPPPMEGQYSGSYQGQQQEQQAAVPPVVVPLTMPQAPGSPKEALWMELFADPSSWWDNRAGKVADASKSKVPDFKHKDKAANKVLWVNNKDTPTWVLDSLKRPAYINN